MFRTLRNWLSIKVLLGAFVFGVGIFTVLVWFLWSAKGSSNSEIPATAILKVIEAPTQTPLVDLVTLTPTSKPTTSQAAPTPIGDINISVGKYVQVSGTGGDGLRLHNNPSVGSKVNYVAIDSEVFIVKDGPIDADGYLWWELEDPYTNEAVGWGVANYLVIVQNP